MSDLDLALLAAAIVIVFTLTFRALTSDKRGARREALILEALTDYSAGLTGHELQQATGISSEMFYPALSRLLADGLVRSWLAPLTAAGHLRRCLYGLPAKDTAS